VYSVVCPKPWISKDAVGIDHDEVGDVAAALRDVLVEDVDPGR
jgi:hypothetical protein